MGVAILQKEREEILKFIEDIFHYLNGKNQGYVPFTGFSLWDKHRDWREVKNEAWLIIGKIKHIKQGAILKVEVRDEVSIEAVFAGAPSETGLYFEIDPKKLESIRAQLQSQSQKPERIIHINNRTLYVKGKIENLKPDSVAFILLKALLELIPEGGTAKYKDIIHKMSKLGIRKIGNHRGVSNKMIQNAKLRLTKYRYDDSYVVDIERGRGVIFRNPQF